jgi:hypothetical protein
MLEQASTRSFRHPCISRYRRSSQSDLFGDQVGSVAVREISKVIATDELSFEVRMTSTVSRTVAVSG